MNKYIPKLLELASETSRNYSIISKFAKAPLEYGTMVATHVVLFHACDVCSKVDNCVLKVISDATLSYAEPDMVNEISKELSNSLLTITNPIAIN